MWKKILFLFYALCWGLFFGFVFRVFGLEITDPFLGICATLTSAIVMAMSKSRVETQSTFALYAMLFALFFLTNIGIFLIMWPHPF